MTTMNKAGLVYLLILAATLFGCAHDDADDADNHWSDRTSLPRGESVTSLNARANNAAVERDERARAVFTLFAHHIRPGFSGAEVRRVLGNTAWLKDIHLYGVRELAGWSAVPLTSDGTVFTMLLFPVEMNKRWSPWGIVFRLSGKLRDEDALAFLRGERTGGSPEIEEFALVYPVKRNADGGLPAGEKRTRIERFSRRGIHVYE